MEKKTPREILLGIYNETLESLITQQINIDLYKDLDPEENIVPQEAVDAGLRPAKTAKQRIKEIEEMIETKEKTLKLIDKKLADIDAEEQEDKA